MESFAKISPSSSSSTTSLPFLVLNSFCNDFLVNFLGLDDEMWVKSSFVSRHDACVGGIGSRSFSLLSLGSGFGFLDICNQFLVLLGNTLLHKFDAKLTDQTLDDVLDLRFEVVLVFVRGGHQVGKQTLHVLGDHFFRQTQNCNLDETQRGFDDLSVSGGKKQFHSLVKIGQQLDIHLGVEFVNQTRERSDGSTNHVGGGTSKTGRTNGEEFLQRCNRIWHFWVIQTVSHWSSLVLQHFGSHNN